MLIYDEQIRLTSRERDILRRLTGVEPKNVTSRTQLKDWSERYLQALPDDAREIRLIKAVLRRHLPV